MPIKVLFFDVFGTVVDWRSGVAREAAALGKKKGVEADWHAFADEWRNLYHPGMEEVRSGRREWVNLEVLHWENLLKVLPKFGLELSETEIDELVLAWHRLDPWPDSVAGITRLKAKFIVSTLSNGTVRLLVDMAKRGGLPWDAILCSETARAYKPAPEAYLRNAALLQAKPEECMLVAAHNHDLLAAQRQGFHTAFVARPAERGPGQTKDLKPEGKYDYAAASMMDLADQLGCG